MARKRFKLKKKHNQRLYRNGLKVHPRNRGMVRGGIRF